MAPPGFDEDLSLLEGVEDLSVKELVAEPDVEALDVAVLPRRSRLDEGNVEEEWLAEIGCNEYSTDRWAALKAREGYMNHLVRTAHEGTAFEIFAATLPCCVGFAEIGDWLKDEDISEHRAVYRKWIEHYRRPFQREQVNALVAALETCTADLRESDLEAMDRVFLRSVQHQIHVFDAAWRLGDPWPGPGSFAG